MSNTREPPRSPPTGRPDDDGEPIFTKLIKPPPAGLDRLELKRWIAAELERLYGTTDPGKGR